MTATLDILLLGFSSIVARRVLPALQGLPGIGKIHIASRRSLNPETVAPHKRGRIFQDYERALAELPPALTYVSLPNSLHATWARQALEAGSHVIVDKPACTCLADAEALLGLASTRGLCLAEATVWSSHPQFAATSQLLSELGQSITRVNAFFSFPPLPKDNFRNDPRLGGGCIFDLGPYAASCGRLFFHDPPVEIVARVNSRHPESGLETAFSLLATYSNGRALTGHFGFDTEYRNSISLLGPAFALEFDRAFTTPADCAPRVPWRTRNQGQILACPAGDSFALFLQSVVESILGGEWNRFSLALLQDARFVHQIRKATGIITE